MLLLRYPLVLGSASPRRRQILHDAGFKFSVKPSDADESFPAALPAAEVAPYLARHKAQSFDLQKDTLLLTADTVVRIDEAILNKPADGAEARQMLRRLSGRPHLVTTGIALRTPEGRLHVGADTAEVFFRELTDAEINYYVSTCHPLDKAGAYGVQDFIGMVGIEKMYGSYFTVMGLPVHLVYRLLQPYLEPLSCTAG